MTIGDDSSGDFCTIDERDHQRIVQLEPLFGATAAASFARKNIRNTIGFAVEKAHASREAAVQFVADHPDSLPGQGSLHLIQSSTERDIEDAVLVNVRLLRLNGVSTVFHYTWTGGLVSTPIVEP